MQSISLRLDAVLSLLKPCARLADVGTDHGLLPIGAVQRGIAATAIAADLRAAPLSIARHNVQLAGLSERVTLLEGDGLLALTGHGVDAVVMAGVSGKLMVRLLTAAPALCAELSQLVVQPNKDAAVVRGWALGHGFHLRDERLVYERGRFFVVCAFYPAQGPDPAYRVADFGSSDLSALGPILLAHRDPLAARFYDEQVARLQPLVASGVSALAPELALFRAARAYVD